MYPLDSQNIQGQHYFSNVFISAHSSRAVSHCAKGKAAGKKNPASLLLPFVFLLFLSSSVSFVLLG